jgi:low affinity Fe/Cu permease
MPMEKALLEGQTHATNDAFGKFAAAASGWLGSKWAFAGAGIIIVLWAAVGPVFHFSNSWQLVINTGTTIVTFLMVFLIQNTQNRDAKALHLKLDELIRSHHPANDDLIDIQKLSDEELDQLEKRYEKIRKACEARRAAKAPEAVAKHESNNGAKNGGKHGTQATSSNNKPAA